MSDSKSVAERPVVRVRDGRREELPDSVVVEEPLEIRAADEVLAITMRTPGADRELAVGFLWAEGVIASRDDIGAVYHCGRVGTPEYGNAINLAPGGGVSLDLDRVSATRRGTITTASCGVCGRTSVDDVMKRCAAVPRGPKLPEALLAGAMDRLRERQPAFDRTGGLHAALVMSAAGEVLAAFEDIGRHNAVDKCIGALVLSGRIGSPGDERPALLAVSGRASFEIVQKAAAARLYAIASVSAASSLAIDLAQALGVTLAGFVRGGGMTVYTHADALAPSAG